MNAEIQRILNLDAGAELDAAVHAALFGGVGKPGCYSSDGRAALKILEAIPNLYLIHANAETVSFWRAGEDATKIVFNPAKAYWAGRPMNIVVKCSDPLIALCKAAVLFKAQEKGQ